MDVIVRLWKADHLPGVALIERRNLPRGLALPGGFVEIGATVETAAVREVQEEIGVDVRVAYLLGVYSDPKRDPRLHTASVVFVGDWSDEPRAASDARKVFVYLFEKIPLDQLVFDHREIISDFLQRWRDEDKGA